MNKGLELEKKIARQLKDAKIPFETQVSVGGLRADFVVRGPDDRLIIIEAKSWDPKPGFTARAVQQARLYQEALRADAALIVLDELKRNMPSDGVVTINGLIPALKAELEKPRKRRARIETGEGRPTVFAAMPFSHEYDDVYFVAMSFAAESAGAVCTRIDRQEFEGDIVERIKKSIEECIAVIADLSESKPNVLYEAGYAHALKRPTVHICSTRLEDLPFDVRNWNTIEYKKGQTHQLRKALARRLRSVMQ